MKVLVTPTSLGPQSPVAALAELRAAVDEVVFSPRPRPLTSAELVSLVGDVDGVLAGLDEYDDAVLAAAPALRVISRYGAGCDRVDLAAAAARGVVVTCTPGANTTAVAELAWALMLAAARGVPELDRAVQRGGRPRGPGIELTGKTLGLVGFGAIGRAVAQRAAGFDMRLLVHDPYQSEAAVRAAGAEAVDLDRVFRESDVISLHAPLTDATRHLVDATALAHLRQGAILVNTSRGGLLDEDAVLAALADGRLRGVGLDVYEHEPPTDSRLVGAAGVVCTPHVGAHTTEAVERMASMAVRNLLDVLVTGTSTYRVDAPVQPPRAAERKGA